MSGPRNVRNCEGANESIGEWDDKIWGTFSRVTKLPSPLMMIPEKWAQNKQTGWGRKTQNTQMFFGE